MINSESKNSNILGDMFSGSLSPLWISPPPTRANTAACYARFSSTCKALTVSISSSGSVVKRPRATV